MSDYVTRTDRIERWLSLAVGLAAICTVGVSLYQTSLAREQLRASAWPYVSQGNGFAGGAYKRYLANEGIGPARVRSFQVFVDGKPVKTWNEAVRRMTGDGEAQLTYSSFGRGTVMPAGTTREVLNLPPNPRGKAFWVAAQTRLRTVVCFCSVYDECWSGDSEEQEREGPRPVKACRADPTAEFTQ